MTNADITMLNCKHKNLKAQITKIFKYVHTNRLEVPN